MPEPEPLDSYIMVEKDDVMDAMAAFVAAYLMQLPEAQHLKPDELQRALGGAIAVRLSVRCMRWCSAWAATRRPAHLMQLLEAWNAARPGRRHLGELSCLSALAV